VGRGIPWGRSPEAVQDFHLFFWAAPWPGEFAGSISAGPDVLAAIGGGERCFFYRLKNRVPGKGRVVGG